MRVLLVVAPMTQLNTPYPATAYLTGFLRSRGIDAVQADLALELVLWLLSREGVDAIAEEAARVPKRKRTPSVRHFLDHLDRYRATVEPAVRFLQGKDPTLAMRIESRAFLPEGPRFAVLEQYEADESGDPLGWAFGALGLQDRAKYLATLFVDDLADVVRDAVDPRFELVRYAESLAASQATFDPLAEALATEGSLVDRTLERLTADLIQRERPDLVGVSAPFAGNVYGAFRIAKAVRAVDPRCRLVLGGGFANTELRELAEPRVFDFFDHVVLDDGEQPFLCLIEHHEGRRPSEALKRTFCRAPVAAGVPPAVIFHDGATEPDVPFAETGTPTWDGLPLDRYLAVLELLNPMHRLWSDGRWNKITVAHGCYWKKCSFCDTTLDYIGRYDPAGADLLVDRIEAIVRETGQSGFHLVDEAAPPGPLRAMAEAIVRRDLALTWWGNIRFEKTFTPALCELLARSGCVAVSGGLEVASDRLLKLMKKGVSVGQVARVTRAFGDAGVLVHAYLMYGFPTQTTQETVDALEYVRQLFEAGCLQSAYWHRFAATAHSPIGRDPGAFGIRLLPEPDVRFARNDIDFEDPTGTDHDALGPGLNKALYNFMHGIGLDEDVRAWFDVRVPRTTIPSDFIQRALAKS